MDNNSTDANNGIPVIVPQNQSPISNPPQQFQQPVAPESPQPPRRSKKKIIVLIISLLFVIAAAVILILWHPWSSNTSSFGWHAPQAPQLSAEQITELEQKYGYDITYRPDVSPTEQFSFKAVYDYGACQNSTCADAIAVYSTADLSKKVDSFTLSNPSNSVYGITVSPPVYNKATDSSKIDATGLVNTSDGGDSLAISGEKRWGIAEMYFLVQRLDEKGAKLSRPKVTVFTVKADQKMLQATDLTANVDVNGAVSFSWSAVENAKEYYLVKVQRGKTNNYVAKYTVIARTSDTSLNLADYNGDKSRAEKALSAQGTLSPESSTYSQNNQLSYYGIKSEDDFYKEDGSNSLPAGKYVPVDNGVVATSFAVVAVNSDSYSPAREIDGNALLASAPVSLAGNQSIFMIDQRRGSDVYSYGRLYTTQPITMADGHTAKKAVIFDYAKASVNTSLTAADELTLPYVVQGTYIAGSDTIYGAKGTFTKDFIKSKVEELNKRNIAAVPSTGSVGLQYIVKTDTDNLQLSAKTNQTDTTTQSTQDKVSNSKSIPQVEYPVNGSTNLVKYIAANLMAGNYAIDIKNYYTDPTVGIWDAFWEAVYQNPYVSVNSGYIKGIQLNGSVLTVRYEGVSKDEMINRQKALLNQAKSVASSVTNTGMSDRNKALAINKWLSDNATYDYDALTALEKGKSSNDYSVYYTSFPYAWNGLGTAVHNKGVCASYADAFKALADQAGLKAITVIGTDNVSGGAHAWNKAFIDGKWQVVDVTWDDDSDHGSYTKYFGMTDAVANRVQDEGFMVNRFIGDYAAN